MADRHCSQAARAAAGAHRSGRAARKAGAVGLAGSRSYTDPRGYAWASRLGLLCLGTGQGPGGKPPCLPRGKAKRFGPVSAKAMRGVVCVVCVRRAGTSGAM